MNDITHPKNFLDRLVEFVSPRLAASRYEARAAIEIARRSPSASHRGAIASRADTAWSPSTSYRGGRASDRRAYAKMRSRARRVYQENPIGRSLLNTETDNVAADFTLQMRSASKDFNKEAESRFYPFLETADVAGGMSATDWFRTSWMEPRKDGDGGILLVERGGKPKLQYVPGDLIMNPWTGAYDPRTTFDGVECDPSGRPQRFWVRDVDEAGHDTFTDVDASDMVYLAHREDPMSVRGVTVYSPIFGSLDQIDAYVDAVTIAARMACIFGLIMKRNRPASVLSQLASMTNSKGDEQKAITLENGMLNVIGTDEDVVQVQAQQPLQQAPDWIRAAFRLICLPFDMPLEIGMKDLSQVNFSGGRIGLIGYYRSCRVKQEWLKSRCWNRIVFWWLSKERKRQQLGYPDAFKAPFPEDYGTFELHGREWDYNDPVAEAQADLLEISMGIKSPQQASALRGRDWDDTQDQIESARASNTKRNIPFVLSSLTRDPVSVRETITAAPGATPPADPQKSLPPAK